MNELFIQLSDNSRDVLKVNSINSENNSSYLRLSMIARANVKPTKVKANEFDLVTIYFSIF